MRKLAVSALLVTVAACGGHSTATPRTTAQAVASKPSPPLTVTPSEGGKHDRFKVAVTVRHATGVFGKTRRMYLVEAHAVRPAVACVNGRDRAFGDLPAGSRIHATLAPQPGKGGALGWCRGRFRGTVTYTEAFACPAKGACHPPGDFPTRTQVVERFSFRVR
jgi:hypothetical protein